MATTISTTAEPAIEPDLAIVDAHHHFWGDGHSGAQSFGRFVPDDLVATMEASGHSFVATVYVDCGWAFRADGPEHLRCVGETEYVDAVAHRFALNAGPTGRIGAGIVGRADLMLGDAVAEVLEAHIAASPARFRGIRELLAYDPDVYQALNLQPGRSRDPRFRAGFRQLARLGLSFDALCVHTMLGEMVELARAFCDTPIILNHLAGPIGLGRFAGQRDEVLAEWRASLAALADCPNISIKLSGIGSPIMGFGWPEADASPGSTIAAMACRPYIEAAVDAFSPARCMVASNFPVDGKSFDYGTLWNALKLATAGYTQAERAALFHGTASRVYRLSP